MHLIDLLAISNLILHQKSNLLQCLSIALSHSFSQLSSIPVNCIFQDKQRCYTWTTIEKLKITFLGSIICRNLLYYFKLNYTMVFIKILSVTQIIHVFSILDIQKVVFSLFYSKKQKKASDLLKKFIKSHLNYKIYRQ